MESACIDDMPNLRLYAQAVDNSYWVLLSLVYLGISQELHVYVPGVQ